MLLCNLGCASVVLILNLIVGGILGLEQATSWKLEDAIQLFYVGNEGGAVASASHPPPTETWPEVLERHVRGMIYFLMCLGI